MADSQRKTANLFDKYGEKTSPSNTTYNYTLTGLTPNAPYTCSTNFVGDKTKAASLYFAGGNTGTNGVWSDTPKTFNTNADGEITVYVRRITVSDSNPAIYDDLMSGTIWIMVNEGSTPLPYEPYWQHSLRKLGTSTDTITTLPADVYADGNNATVGLVGNMVQSGTPSPSSIVIPQETGERTANLFDKNTATTNYYVEASSGNLVYGTRYFASDYIAVSQGEQYRWNDLTRGNAGAFYDSNKQYISGWSSAETRYIFTVPNGASYVRLTGEKADLATYMLVEGSTALPYEPYGVKIPILSANTTTPVYLSEVQSARRIKKLVLDGTEGWAVFSDDTKTYRLVDAVPTSATAGVGLCTHYVVGTGASTLENEAFYMTANRRLYIRDTNCDTLTAFTTYLAQQYSAGIPVTVWYVLATEETGVVNEPLRKIGNYADTVSGITIPTIAGANSFDVLTTLKPSEVSLAYTGWHDASVKEWDGSEWQ